MQFSFTNGRQFYNKVKEVFKGIYSTFSTHEARTSALELALRAPVVLEQPVLRERRPSRGARRGVAQTLDRNLEDDRDPLDQLVDLLLAQLVAPGRGIDPRLEDDLRDGAKKM
jgi:hypothetical protein